MKKQFLIMLMLSVLLVLACMTSAMAAYSAMSGEEKCNGNHTMTMSPQKTPTCLEGGLGVVYCTTCGYVQDDHYEFSQPLGHK